MPWPNQETGWRKKSSQPWGTNQTLSTIITKSTSPKTTDLEHKSEGKVGLTVCGERELFGFEAAT